MDLTAEPTPRNESQLTQIHEDARTPRVIRKHSLRRCVEPNPSHLSPLKILKSGELVALFKFKITTRAVLAIATVYGQRNRGYPGNCIRKI